MIIAKIHCVTRTIIIIFISLTVRMEWLELPQLQDLLAEEDFKNFCKLHCITKRNLHNGDFLLFAFP